MKKILFSLLMLCSMTAAWAQDDGFVTVASASQMYNVLSGNAHAKVRLTADIYLSDLGADFGNTFCSTFYGILDGDGHAIKGDHYADNTTQRRNRTYLFTYSDGATIKNITFKHINKSSSDHGNQCILTSQAKNNCVFENITFDNCGVSCDKEPDGLNVGAAAGYAENCTFTNITVKNSDFTIEKNQLGAVVGYAKNCTFTNIKVENCENTANGGSSGGVAGRADDCKFNNVEILGTIVKTEEFTRIGGVVGVSISSDYANCIVDDQSCICADGEWLLDEGYLAEVGGIAGEVYGGSFTNCINSALVAADGKWIGGIAGRVYESVSFEDCLNTGMVISMDMDDVEDGFYNKYKTKSGLTCVTKTYNGKEYVIRKHEAVGSDSYVGGIIGESEDYCTINRCANLGSVYSTAKDYVGGIAGRISLGKVTNCLTDFDAGRYTDAICAAIGDNDGGECFIGSCLNMTTYKDFSAYSNNWVGFKSDENNYSLTTNEDAHHVNRTTAAKIKSGEICALLGAAWEQNVGVDPYPTPTGNKGLMADNTPLSVTVTFEVGSFVYEQAGNAFDGKPETKWCGGILTTNNTNAYVQVQLAEKSKLDYYYLYTGNDINYENSDGKQQRNPKEWNLYAKVNEGDEWTLISHVTDAGLPTTVSTRSNNYKIDAAYRNIEYNYLKFEILQIEKGDIFEVGEICFINCNHTFGSDDICTECGYKKPSHLSFTIDESLGGFSSEGPDRAIDGKPETKWCGDFSKGNPYIVLKNDGKAKLDHYHLYTGNDIFSGGNNRNPNKWKLYAKENASDEWTEISDVTDAQLPTTTSSKSKDYTIAKESQNTYYKFFKFEILGVEKGDIYEVGELCLMGCPCQHQYEDESVFCSICGDIKEHEHIFNDDLKCTVCGHEISADCVIEYTATERLSYIYKRYGDEEELVFDYTDIDPDDGYNWGEWLFEAPAIKHEYDETTQKGRIIFNAPVTGFDSFTEFRRDRLRSITIPSSVTYIAEGAFDDCSNLTSITILTEQSKEIYFDRCNNLQEIIVPYNLYHNYVKIYDDYDEDDEDDYDYGKIKTLIKSLLPLDDTKAFETPESEVKVDATLQRSFANDGWYSLCVPFSVSVADSPFSQVAEFKELDGDTYKFTTVDNIEAGKAYIVKVDAAVANPTFKNVFITTKAPASDGDFIGVYSPTVLGAGCKVIGSGTTVNPVNAGTMKGFRAYFPASAAGAKAMRFTVDDGEATDIQSLTEAEGNKLKAKGAYNLAGQKVDENYRGIVVRNGKKVLKK